MTGVVGSVSKRAIIAVLVFGAAFGYLEAAVVAYLRVLHEPARQRFYPGRPPGDLFPLLTLEQLRSSGVEQQNTLAIEIGREAATLIMLAGVALTVARRAGEWAALFAIVFGIWDITFYLFLKLLLDWPRSLLTWDILFLLPVPWVGPVLAPVIVSATMVGAGLWHLRRESTLGPVLLRARHWFGMVLGAAVIVLSFTLDYRNLLAGGMPRPFHWPIFGLGLAIGIVSYAAAVWGERAPTVAAALLVAAIGPADWVPARWPADSRTLDLLKGTPINCLLVNWGAEACAEARGFARAAHARQIAVVGLLHPGADPVRGEVSAREAGFDGIVFEAGFNDGAKDESRPLLNRSAALQPGIRAVTDPDTVDATPTSEPWIDSNLWLARSLRSLSGARPVWLAHTLENPSPEDYERAIADAAAGGARWVVAPDDSLWAGLLRGEPGALAAWRRIAAALDFHERHADWREFTPAAALGVIRDRSAADPDMSNENLNLITRRRIPYRLIERAALSSASLEGLPAVLAADLAPPTDAERKLLAAFEKMGGTVVFAKNPPDPEALSRELVDVIGNENLPVRLFNVPSVLAQVSTAPGGARLLVQLINYATAPAERVTVRAAGEYRGARLFSYGAPPVELKVTRSGGRTEVRVERIAVYAALLFEK